MNLGRLSYKDLEMFDKHVLDIDNEHLEQYLIKGKALKDEHDNRFMRLLQDYIERRKEGEIGNANWPKPP